MKCWPVKEVTDCAGKEKRGHRHWYHLHLSRCGVSLPKVCHTDPKIRFCSFLLWKLRLLNSSGPVRLSLYEGHRGKRSHTVPLPVC